MENHTGKVRENEKQVCELQQNVFDLVGPSNQDRDVSDRIFTNPEHRGMMGKREDLTILSDHVTY